MRKGTLRLTPGLYTHTQTYTNGEREEEKEGGREGGKGLKTISQGDQSERGIHREGSLYSDQPLRSGIRRGMWPDRLGKTLAAAHREYYSGIKQGGQVCRARASLGSPMPYSTGGLALDRGFPQKVCWVETPQWLT